MPFRPSTSLLHGALASGVLALVLALAPAPAAAWADATVRSARATVELEDGVRVRVAMTIELRVDGGWLEAFELDGLDAGLALDAARPPTFVRHLSPATDELRTTDSAALALETLAPRITSHERGRVSFAFARRHAPRRGDYRVELFYVAPLASAPVEASSGSLLGWTFPAWRFGLDGVEIELLLPAGSMIDPALRAAAEGDAGIVIESSTDADGRAHVHLVRHHLPRTRAWPLTFIVPASVAPVPVLDVTPPRRAASPGRPDVASEPLAWGTLLGALALFLLVLGKNAALAREDREGGRARVLAGFLRTLGAFAAVAASFMLAAASPSDLPVPLVALALTGAHGRVPGASAPREGTFRAASPVWVRSAHAAHRRATRGLPAWLRVTTLRGASLALVLACAAIGTSLVAPAALPLHHATVLAAGAFLVLASGGRSMRERSPLTTLGALLDVASRLRLPEAHEIGVAFLPVVRTDTSGRVDAARLRIVVAASPPGLVRLDLVLRESGETALVAVARAGTAAAERLAALTPLEPAPRERTGFVLPTGPDVGAAVATLALVLATPPSAAAANDPATAAPGAAAAMAA